MNRKILKEPSGKPQPKEPKEKKSDAEQSASKQSEPGQSASKKSNPATLFHHDRIEEASHLPWEDEDYDFHPIGQINWDIDGVLIKYAESKKLETSHTSGTYVFLNRERIIKVLKKAINNNIRNICLTARRAEEKEDHWLSAKNIVAQYESKKGEFFDGIRYTNHGLKALPLQKIIGQDFDLEATCLIDDSDYQLKNCKEAGIPHFKITNGSDEEFDPIEQYLDALIARKNKKPKKL